MSTYNFVTIVHPEAGQLTVGRSNVTGEWYVSIDPRDSDSKEQAKDAKRLIKRAKEAGEPFIYHPITNSRLVRMDWLIDVLKGPDSAQAREKWMQYLEHLVRPHLEFN